MNGTISTHGLHLYGAISDSQGRTIGGHVGDGCIIYTTAEIVLGCSSNLLFLRSLDLHTGFLELEITHPGSLESNY